MAFFFSSTSQTPVSPVIQLYHYTDKKGEQGIKTSKRINKAIKHAFSGDGVYFNGLMVNGSNVTKEMMAVLNYGNSGASMWYLGKGFVDYVISVDIPFNEVQLEIPYRRVWRYPKTYLDLNKYTHTIQQVPATMGDTGVSMTAENNYEITRDLL